jgi:hypothetical protein
MGWPLRPTTSVPTWISRGPSRLALSTSPEGGSSGACIAPRLLPPAAARTVTHAPHRRRPAVLGRSRRHLEVDARARVAHALGPGVVRAVHMSGWLSVARARARPSTFSRCGRASARIRALLTFFQPRPRARQPRQRRAAAQACRPGTADVSRPSRNWPFSSAAASGSDARHRSRSCGCAVSVELRSADA